MGPNFNLEAKRSLRILITNQMNWSAALMWVLLMVFLDTKGNQVAQVGGFQTEIFCENAIETIRSSSVARATPVVMVCVQTADSN